MNHLPCAADRHLQLLFQEVPIDYGIQKQQKWNPDGKARMFGFVPFPVHRDPNAKCSSYKGKQE